MVSALVLLANNNGATASLYTFVILLGTASVVIVYFAGTASAWKHSPGIGRRLVLAFAFLFLAFAVYGMGLEPVLWSLVLLAIGLVIRWVMQRLNARAGSSPVEELAPAAPPGSSA